MCRRQPSRALLFGFAVGAGSLVLSLSGCSPGAPDSVPDEPPPTQRQTPRDEQPREDLTEEQVVEWQDAEVVDEYNIRLTFWMGNEHCFGVRPVVRETETEVAIAIITGRLPNAPEVCTAEARQASMVVQTKQPVRDREIVPMSSADLDF